MSLRAKVVLSLTLLMASAMLLISVVMLKVSQRDLIQAKVKQGMLLRGSLERILNIVQRAAGEKSESMHSRLQVAGLGAEASAITGPWRITVTDPDGYIVYGNGAARPGQGQRLAGLEEVTRLGVESISFIPSRQSRWWLLPERMVLDAPLFRRTKVIGAVRLDTSLADLRRSLWRSQGLILFCIVLDVLVIVAFGTYIFSKLVVKPVHHLVQTAERFQEGDRLPDLSAQEPSELGKLSQALNGMLNKLAENKEELHQHIISLEQANLELNRAQQEVIFSEKLASVGRLAAGVAHEIGNPIGIVLGYLELLQREDTAEDERQEIFSRMESEIQRIHQIIRQLLDFSRPSSSERQTIAVHPLVRETAAVLDHQFRKQGVDIILDLLALSDTVWANADQLKQVFVNLMVNAADAMASSSEGGRGGRLRVSTRYLTAENLAGERAEGPPLRRRTDPLVADYRNLRRRFVTGDDHWVEIQFADTGVGIPKDDQERIFDPFFTTKEVGKGTGLGLSVSIKIIETFGGRIKVSSNLGEGTTVSIMLPSFDEAGNQQAEAEKERQGDMET